MENGSSPCSPVVDGRQQRAGGAAARSRAGSRASARTDRDVGSLAFVAPLANWAVGALANEASGRALFFPAGWVAADVTCLTASFSFGLAPAAVALVLLLRGAPLRPAATALAFGASAGALGAIVVHAACAMEPSARHLALGHALPAIVGALAALPLVPLLSRWRSR